MRNLPGFLTLPAFGHGATAWLFAVTGPFLIFVNAAKQGNLSAAELNSWIFALYFFGGVLTLILALYYRQPIPAAGTIAGGVLVGVALKHLSFSEAIGAYLLTGTFLTLLGFTGLVKKGMELLPMPIMMGMVAGVLLPFGVGIMVSLEKTPVVSGAAFLAFIAVSLVKPIARRFPPVLGAIAVGLAATAVAGEASWQSLSLRLAEPIVFVPTFTLPAALELVIPLAVTVVAIQNAQGIGILVNEGYRPPINAITIASGVGSLFMGIFGSQSACIAGPMTGIIASPSTGRHEGRYAAAVVTGVLWILFGLFAPVATGISEILPSALINLLAGLALLGVLASCFGAAFTGKFRMGALFTFIITISGITLLNIGAPFWGLVGGTLISALLEPADFREMLQAREQRRRAKVGAL
mgnify:CR=1 FL=1